MQKRFFTALMIALCLTIATPALAEEIVDPNTPVSSDVTTAPEDTANSTVVADTTTESTITEVSADDLGVAEPTVLPGSFFYPFKRLTERIQEGLTFNSTAKAELQQRLANKRLVEARKLATNGKSEEATKVLEDYKLKMEAAQDRLSSIDRASLTPEQQAKLDGVSDRITANLLKQQAVLERVEAKVPEQAREKIRENIERNQKRVEERLSQLPADKKEEVKTRIEAIMNELPKDELTRAEYLEKLKIVRSEVVPAAVIENIEAKREEVKKKVEDAVASGKISKEEATERLEQIEKRSEERIQKVQERSENIKQNIETRIEDTKKIQELKTKAQEATTPEAKKEIRQEVKEIKNQTKENMQEKAKDLREKIKQQTTRPQAVPVPKDAASQAVQ